MIQKKDNISINPNTKEEYLIPDNLDDKKNLKKFLDKNKGKKVIVVQGLGFVGAVMSIVCANSITDEYAVIGIDLANKDNFWKIQSINNGIFPLSADDEKIDLFFKNSIKKGNLYATYDSYAYSLADTIIVDINLDVNKYSDSLKKLQNYNLDLSSFETAISTIGKYCKQNALILVETTVPPGTCEKIVKPILKNELSKRGLDNKKIKIGHSYERVMPGPNYIDSIQNFYRVFSGVNDESIKATEKFLKTIINTSNYPLTQLKSTNATEMAKVLENSYRAMNIAFIVEWSRFAEKSGVDLYEVVDAIRQRPTHSNMMYPGIGVGGYCLTKDPLMASWSKQKMFNSKGLSQSEKAIEINDQMPLFAFNFFMDKYKDSLKNKNILFFGVSYRGDVGDTRYTPVELLYNLFIEKKSNVFLHDPTLKFWEEKNVDIESSLKKSLEKDIDIAIISTGHSCYKTDNFIKLIYQKSSLTIFDTLGLFDSKQVNTLQKKHRVIVLGRGDI